MSSEQVLMFNLPLTDIACYNNKHVGCLDIYQQCLLSRQFFCFYTWCTYWSTQLSPKGYLIIDRLTLSIRSSKKTLDEIVDEDGAIDVFFLDVSPPRTRILCRKFTRQGISEDFCEALALMMDSWGLRKYIVSRLELFSNVFY